MTVEEMIALKDDVLAWRNFLQERGSAFFVDENDLLQVNASVMNELREIDEDALEHVLVSMDQLDSARSAGLVGAGSVRDDLFELILLKMRLHYVWRVERCRGRIGGECEGFHREVGLLRDRQWDPGEWTRFLYRHGCHLYERAPSGNARIACDFYAHLRNVAIAPTIIDALQKSIRMPFVGFSLSFWILTFRRMWERSLRRGRSRFALGKLVAR